MFNRRRRIGRLSNRAAKHYNWGVPPGLPSSDQQRKRA